MKEARENVDDLISKVAEKLKNLPLVLCTSEEGNLSLGDILREQSYSDLEILASLKPDKKKNYLDKSIGDKLIG